MLRKSMVYLLVVSGSIFFSIPAMANVTAVTSTDLGGTGAELSLSYTSVEKDVDSSGGREWEINSDVIGINLSKNINKKLKVFGTFGYLMDGDLQRSGATASFELDDAYHLSAGAGYKVFDSGPASVNIYGQFDYILEETYSVTAGTTVVDLELEGFEVTIGGVFNYQIDPKLSAFAGVSFVPIEEIEATMSAPGFLDSNYDLERKDQLGVKIGGQYRIDNRWVIRGEANFGSATAYGLSIGAKF